MDYDLTCPYCGHEQNFDRRDGHGYEEGVAYKEQCSACKKYFVFYTNIIFNYEPRKADCLNNGGHIWKPTITCPKESTWMQCQTCDATRLPTKEEMEEILKEVNP